MPHQNSLLDILLFDWGQSCVDLSPIGNYNFRTFSMGLKLYRVTIFFGSHVPNFLEALSSLVLLFSDLQGRLHVLRMRKMPHQNLSSIAFFLPQINTVSIWAPWKILIFDGAQTLKSSHHLLWPTCSKLSTDTIFFASAVFRLATTAYPFFACTRRLTRI